MENYLTSDLHPTGIALFDGFETLLKDLSEEDESMISGGSRSNSRPKRRKRPVRNRRRNQRINRNASNSRS